MRSSSSRCASPSQGLSAYRQLRSRLYWSRLAALTRFAAESTLFRLWIIPTLPFGGCLSRVWPGLPISPVATSCRPMVAPGMISTILRWWAARSRRSSMRARSYWLVCSLVGSRALGRPAGSGLRRHDSIRCAGLALLRRRHPPAVLRAAHPVGCRRAGASPPDPWRAGLALGVGLGVTFALAVATKVSALPLPRPSSWLCCYSVAGAGGGAARCCYTYRLPPQS